MRIKKILSVFLAVVMLLGVMSLGFTGAASEIDYTAQYRALAIALQNEHVRELANYTITSTTLENGNDGFDQEARGFAYDHRVIASDNEAGDILVASNRFYFIAESLMSYTYGVGCYDASTLVSYITEKIKPYFASTSGEVIYEDFYGERYYPTAEELEAYNNAVSLITAAGAEVSQATLTEFGIYFMEMDDWSYYNVETVLKYFTGNVLKINSGNWFHRFSFIVQTSVNDILEDCDGLNFASDTLTMRTAIYEYDYKKEYNESKSKAYFSFKQTSLSDVWENYASEFGMPQTSADLTQPENGYPGLLYQGQAANYLIKIEYDNTIIPYFSGIIEKFDTYINKRYDEVNNVKWDSQFVTWTDATVKAHSDTPIILGYAADLANNYSNEALQAVFGNRLGNMVTLAYLFKTSYPDYFSDSEYSAKGLNSADDVSNPSRTVRGDAQYVATADKLDDIIHDLDALVSPNENEVEDVKISNRVATVVSMFLDVGDMLGIEGEVDYSTLEDLIGKILQELVFSDSIINMLVEMLYPMIVDLLVDNLGTIDVIGDTAVDLVEDIIDNNGLAIYPDTLADLLRDRYGSTYTVAATILDNAGGDWAKVNFDGIRWGVDDARTDQKAEVFIDALCAALCGFTNLLVCFLCGNADYLNKDRQDISGAKFGKLYDIELVSGLAWLHSQGLYTKLFIPLYRVLGIPENFYLTDEAFEAAVDKDTSSCLENAVRPIVSWVVECVAKKPFETIMALVPNLVHFLSRQGTVSLSHQSDWQKPNFATDQEGSHEGFADLQTYSLLDILDNVYLSVVGSTLLFGANLYTTSIADLIGDGTLGMLDSLNALLNEIIEFTYDTDDVLSVNIACYSDYNGNIVLPGSTEYALNPQAYPNAHTGYWSDASNTQFSLEKDADHPFYHDNITYVSKPYYIPAVPEAKLTSCGTVNATTNTIEVEHPGLVFKFLLRYLISALGYRYDLGVEGLPTVIECFGLDMESELFNGLTLGDIVANVMLHPDEAICALLELFYSNETGDLYTEQPYTYSVENIDYHEDVLLNKVINPSLAYGADVRYSQYWTREYASDFVSNLGPLVEDVLVMLGMEGMEDGIGPFLENMLNENVFNNDLVNSLFNMIYQLLGGLNESVGMDIEGILSAVLDVNFTPITVARAVDRMIGFETEATRTIKLVETWTGLFDGGAAYDPITGEYTPIIRDVEFDWGLTVNEETGLSLAEENGLSRADAFLRIVSALLSPAAFILKFLFMDYDLSILGLINLPSYAGYQYAFIGLLEALSCPNILTYKEYYEASLDPECGDANVIYNLFAPLLGLLDKVYENPIDTILNLLPNLLFFISIGGLNDFINNLIHFVYVLLDILKPIINAYDLLEGLISNIEISGLTINLSLPLDIDINSLISDLLGTLVGDVLTIGDVSLHLPYIDLYTICVGTVEKFNSKEVRDTVHLNAAGGGDLLTAVLRIVCDVLFMEENHKALSQIISNLAEEGRLDEYDEETLYLVVNGLIGLIEEYEAIDMVLYAVYMLMTKLVPVADTLAPRFHANNMTITDLIDSTSDMDLFLANIQLLLKDPNEQQIPGTATDMDAIGSLFDRIKAFFEKIRLFFQQLFTFG